MTLDQNLPAEATVRERAWRQALLALGLVLLALLLGYRDTAWAMVEVWQRSDTFAHAFVVPPITLWLIWRRRLDLQRLTPQPSPGFALPLLIAALAWLLGDVASINALTQAALVSMLVLAVPLVLGRQVACQIAFPLVFLLFCVPVGEFMMPTLMEATADFTVAALRLSGIPVFREGLQFVIPSGYWSVVEACSGLRYLIASVMVGALFAYLNYRSLRRRAVFIVVATLLPLVANWLRAYLIVMLGHLSGNRLAAGADHLVYGWVFFGVIMMALFMIGSRWAEPDAEPSVGAPAPVTGGVRASWPVGLAALLIVLAPLLLLRVLDARQPSAAPALVLPELAGWQVQESGPGRWQPIFQNPAAQQSAVYARASRQIGLHIAYYRHQGYGSKLVSSSNQLVGSEDRQWGAGEQRPCRSQRRQPGAQPSQHRAAGRRAAGHGRRAPAGLAVLLGRRAVDRQRCAGKAQRHPAAPERTRRRRRRGDPVYRQGHGQSRGRRAGPQDLPRRELARHRGQPGAGKVGKALRWLKPGARCFSDNSATT